VIRMNINVYEVFFIAMTIAISMKFFNAIERLITINHMLSVKVENKIGPIIIVIKDMYDNDVSLKFPALSDYHKWIKNHTKCAQEIPSAYFEKSESD